MPRKPKPTRVDVKARIEGLLREVMADESPKVRRAIIIVEHDHGDGTTCVLDIATDGMTLVDGLGLTAAFTQQQHRHDH